MTIEIDLHCDMGESFGIFRIGNDEGMMKYVTSISVGCGFHGGDPHVMRKTVALAKQYGVAVGAHPGFPDLIGFGRRKLEVQPEEAKDYILYQVGALRAFCDAAGLLLQHVKPHGQFYNMAWTDEALARAILGSPSGNQTRTYLSGSIQHPPLRDGSIHGDPSRGGILCRPGLCP